VCVCLLKVLCPLSRPKTTLDFVLLKDSSRASVAILGPKISSEPVSVYYMGHAAMPDVVSPSNVRNTVKHCIIIIKFQVNKAVNALINRASSNLSQRMVFI